MTWKKLLFSLSVSVTGFALAGTFTPLQAAPSCDYTVSTSTTTIDGRVSPYNSVRPGNTICLQAGSRGFLQIKNITGTVSAPIIFINSGGAVTIRSSQYFGIAVSNSSYFRITGTGDPSNQYGIKIPESTYSGLGVSHKSHNFEIDHIEISGVQGIGVSSIPHGYCLDGSDNDFDYDND